MISLSFMILGTMQMCEEKKFKKRDREKELKRHHLWITFCTRSMYLITSAQPSLFIGQKEAKQTKAQKHIFNDTQIQHKNGYFLSHWVGFVTVFFFPPFSSSVNCKQRCVFPVPFIHHAIFYICIQTVLALS